MELHVWGTSAERFKTTSLFSGVYMTKVFFITNGIQPSFTITELKYLYESTLTLQSYLHAHRQAVSHARTVISMQFHTHALPHARRHATSTFFLIIYSVIGQNKNGKSKYKRLKSSIQRLFTTCKPHEMLYSLLPFPKYFRKYFSLCVQGFAF